MADNWQFWDEDSAPNSRAHISNYGFGQSIYFDDSPGEVLGKLLESALNVHEQTGKTPAELATSLADAQAEIAKLRGALETLETDAHYVFNNPPGECPQIARDVIEWYAGSIRSVLDTK